MLFQVKIPVVHPPPLDPSARQSLTVVGLDFHLSASIQVAQMATDSLEVLPSPAEHFHHDLRRPACRTSNQLDLVLRQAIASTWPPPGIARDIQERSGASDVNESSRHVPAPKRSGWPLAAPSRGREVLPPPSALP